MKAKRWWALLVVFVLGLFSLITSITVESNEESTLNPFTDKGLEEVEIESGSKTNKIAVIRLEGTIMSGDGGLLSGGYNHKSLLEQLDRAANDSFVKGVVLFVDTPGGGVVESDEIHKAILAIQAADKPVYSVMGNTAASGGYYVSAPADKIYAHSATLTGSIGVIMESLNYAELAENLGIDFNTIKSGEHKDILSPNREMTGEEREILQTIIDELQEDFVQIIVDGRDMDETKVKKLADGRVYTGRQAVENGLVDEIGSLDNAIDGLKEEADIKNASIIQYEEEVGLGGFFSMSVADLFGGDSDVQALTKLIEKYDSAPRAMYLYSR